MTQRHPWFATSRPLELASLRPDPAAVLETLHAELEDFPFPAGRPLAPVVLSRRSYAELFWSARALLRLLRRAALASHPTRAGRLAALGVDEEEFPLFTPDEEWELRYCICMARPDVAIGEAGPRFLEFNVSAAIGGVIETHVINGAWLRIYGDQAPFVVPDPHDVRAAMFEGVFAERHIRPAVAMVGSMRDVPEGTAARYYTTEVDRLRRRGIDAEFFEPEELLAGIGPPGQLRFQTGIRNFAVPDWRQLGISIEPVRQALDAGCLLLAPQSSYFVANKKVMAWLSEGQPWMSEADDRLVQRYLPWTRVVADAATTWQGRRVDLLELLAAERERFVLKKATGMQGDGMLIGRVCRDAEWRAGLEAAAAANDTIAQEYVDFARYDLDIAGPDGRPARWTTAPVFSPYLFGGRAAGCMVRYLPTGEPGITSVRTYGAMLNVAVRER
jgi:hypothetical protein